MLGLSGQALAIEVTLTDDGAELVESILGTGITVIPGSIEYQGSGTAAGIFTDGASSGLGMNAGIILSTGIETNLRTGAVVAFA